MNDEQPPLEIYIPVVVWMSEDAEPDDLAVRIFTYPYATREEAGEEAEREAELYREDERVKWVKSTTRKLKLRDMNEYERMDKDSHDKLKSAAGAVGASLLADEGIGPYAGDGDAG